MEIAAAEVPTVVLDSVKRGRASMCYFARIDYECRDWKWGNMKQQCAREWRTGETCGAKLSHEMYTTYDSGYCKICQDIQVKRRRIKKEEENLARWRREPQRFKASIEKAEAERDALLRTVAELNAKRPSVAFSWGGAR